MPSPLYVIRSAYVSANPEIRVLYDSHKPPYFLSLVPGSPVLPQWLNSRSSQFATHFGVQAPEPLPGRVRVRYLDFVIDLPMPAFFGALVSRVAVRASSIALLCLRPIAAVSPSPRSRSE